MNKDDKGLKIGAEEKKLGIKASSTTPLSFDECLIPENRLLGDLGEGFQNSNEYIKWWKNRNSISSNWYRSSIY